MELVLRFKVWIQGIGKHEMFQEPNYMLFYLCKILYRISEKFSLIRECKYDWSNHIKTSYIFI